MKAVGCMKYAPPEVLRHQGGAMERMTNKPEKIWEE